MFNIGNGQVLVVGQPTRCSKKNNKIKNRNYFTDNTHGAGKTIKLKKISRTKLWGNETWASALFLIQPGSFSTFEPQYSYWLLSYMKKCIEHQTENWLPLKIMTQKYREIIFNIRVYDLSSGHHYPLFGGCCWKKMKNFE